MGELYSEEIASWRIALSPGHRFDATQALRQVLSRAVLWGMIEVNPAKLGVDNPSPRRREQRPLSIRRLSSRRSLPMASIHTSVAGRSRRLGH